MRSYRFAAMGTEVHVLLPSGRGGAITPVRELFQEWETTLSRFLPESELSRLNADAGQPVVVGRLLFDVVEASIAAAKATDGIFDPTLLRQLARIGYEGPFEKLRGSLPPTRSTSEEGGGWRGAVLDRHSRTIVVPAGCALDLGGIAKGMTVDASLDLLRARGVEAALVSAGGDLSVLGLPPGGRAWPVLVGDDVEGEVVHLMRGALATSGIAKRTWVQGGLRRHHLLDPRTGEPVAGDLHEVTVAASSCRVAEVAATACFVLGSDRGSEFLASHGLAGLLTRENGTQVTVGSWPSRIPSVA